MKKILKIGILAFVLMGAACSDDTGKGSEKAVETKAIKDGHVVAVHLGDTFEDLVHQGKVQLHNLDKLIQLEKKSDAGEKADPVTISIFNSQKQELAQNTLNYDGKVFTFKNEYEGYKGTPKGEFTCGYMSIRGGSVFLESCKDQDGKEISTMLAFLGTPKAFRDAEEKAK
ncbi:hypothetical protein ACFFJY_17630 [Fictibacillus aquaticus]|uniref:DUF4362 domain-containing protein n=1 Tax=Fictibacillus aquaticus TaxID=2021314 RepID=A0A235F697_9BACL|nr:hypothetical protein [Fictibacillus aquaticus]OYD56633.1 hypothetical protein CGZ90_16620 [Fictibacillus aquaticus]